jgi:uncharacterized membrane protein YfcA
MLPIEIIAILIILMFLISFLYSNLGLGGGMLYVPVMVIIAVSLKRLEIIPVSLFLSFMTQLPAAYTHYKKDYVKLRLGLLFALATLPGVIIGVFIGLKATDIITYCLFAVLMIFTGVKMLYDLYKKRFDKEDKDRDYSSKHLVMVFIISIGSGIVSAFFGVGGGIITVPVLIYILGLYPRRAIGTSAFMIVITAIVGFLCYMLLSITTTEISIFGIAFRIVPEIQYELVLILGPVVMIGAYLGSSWGLKSLKTKSVQIIFIIVIFIVAIQLLLKSLGAF